jgi:Icc protein
METLSRHKFLKYLGISGAALLLPRISLSKETETPPSAEANPRSVRMAHLTDIHVESGKESEQGFASVLQTVNSLIDKPEFIVNGGDSIMNSALNLSRERVKEQWALFHSLLQKHNSLPVHHCLGNHDLYDWTTPNRSHAQSKKSALDEYNLERPYYAFEKDKWKFIVLDSIHGRNTIPGYYAKLDEEQKIWLKNELEITPKNQFICIVSHIPILAVCTMFNGRNGDTEHWNIPNNTLHSDAEELTALFFGYPNIKACLSGHIHMIDHVNYLGIDYFCNGAVSGSWWKGNYHQFPPSFSLMNFFSNGKVEREVIYYNWQSAS